jgi:hypothetical protein
MTSNSDFPDFDTMSPADFEHYLPEIFANGDGRVSTDPQLQTFLKNNPDCAALVRDLETIAETAKSLFTTDEPSDNVWSNIQNKLKQQPADDDAPRLPGHE